MKVHVASILLEAFFAEKSCFESLENSKNWISGRILFKHAANCLLSPFCWCHRFLNKSYVKNLILLAIYLLMMSLGCSNIVGTALFSGGGVRGFWKFLKEWGVEDVEN